MALTVRPATLADASTIAEFNLGLVQESEHKTLDKSVLLRGVQALTSDRAKGLYYLACDGDRVLGQLAISYEWSDWYNGWYWWLQSVYVRPEARGRGVFRLLCEHVVREAKRAGDVASIRLYVDHQNEVGKASYLKLGFKPAGYEVFERPLLVHSE